MSKKSLDPLFRFIPTTISPEKIINELLNDDEFLGEMHTAVDRTLARKDHGFNWKAVRSEVANIDDACQIELCAFQAGFLFGAEFGKRVERRENEKEQR